MQFVNGTSQICQLTLSLKQIIVFTEQKKHVNTQWNNAMSKEFSQLCPNIM